MTQEATQIAKEVLSRLDAAISAATPAAQHAYAIMVREQIVEAWSWLVGSILLWGIVWKARSWAMKAEKYDDQRDCGNNIAIVVGAIAVIITVAFLTCGIPSILNPEYGAIKELLKIVQ